MGIGEEEEGTRREGGKREVWREEREEEKRGPGLTNLYPESAKSRARVENQSRKPPESKAARVESRQCQEPVSRSRAKSQCQEPESRSSVEVREPRPSPIRNESKQVQRSLQSSLRA